MDDIDFENDNYDQPEQGVFDDDESVSTFKDQRKLMDLEENELFQSYFDCITFVCIISCKCWKNSAKE